MQMFLVYSVKVISQGTLGGLMELPEVVDNFSIDCQYFMKLLLVAEAPQIFLEFTKKKSLIVIFLLLKIFAKTLKIPK